MPQPPRPQPAARSRPRPTQQPGAGTATAAGAAVAAAIGAGGASPLIVGGAQAPDAFAALTLAELRAMQRALALTLRRQSAARTDALPTVVTQAYTLARGSTTVAIPGRRAPDVEAARAVRLEKTREATFSRRQAARIRLRLGAIAREPNARKRGQALQGLVNRERHIARQREDAIAERAAGAAEARNAIEQSADGALWQLGHRADHCPGCRHLHGQALPWSVLIAEGMVPPLGPGCGCRLVGVRQAWLGGAVARLPTVLSDTDARAVIAQARRLGHSHSHDGGVPAEMLR